MQSGVFFHMQGLSSDVGNIGVFLDWDVGVYPALSLDILASIYQHNTFYSYNLLSIQGNCVPPNLLKLHSSF